MLAAGNAGANVQRLNALKVLCNSTSNLRRSHSIAGWYLTSANWSTPLIKVVRGHTAWYAKEQRWEVGMLLVEFVRIRIWLFSPDSCSSGTRSCLDSYWYWHSTCLVPALVYIHVKSLLFFFLFTSIFSFSLGLLFLSWVRVVCMTLLIRSSHCPSYFIYFLDKWLTIIVNTFQGSLWKSCPWKRRHMSNWIYRYDISLCLCSGLPPQLIVKKVLNTL